MLNADRLEALRKERYVSEEAFGEALGISERTYKRWLKGDTEPSISVTSKIALLLDTTVAYLLNETDEPKRVVLVAQLSGQRKANIEKMRGAGLKPEDVKKALAYLSGLVDE